ncbi:WRKY transcription factor 18 [Hordeum vulgare]|nr:WRKY transcription factor 18 [Hordeum vulgare]
MRMAVAGAGAAYRFHPHAAGFGRSMAFPRPSGSGCPYDRSGASLSSPAFGAAAGPEVLVQQLDVLDYLSDDGGVPGTAGAPLRVEAPVVPDVGYSDHTSRAAAVAVAVAASGKIAFRTRSEEEILDDGYKWRKYGKKSVKNSPNPRNYYRCSTEGCNVKKRVERDKDDANYVVTMYEGVHNHASPGMIYYAAQDPASGRFFITGTHHLAP